MRAGAPSLVRAVLNSRCRYCLLQFFVLNKERRIHLATEKSSKPRLGNCSFNSLNSRPLGIFPLQNVRLSYLVSGSLLNLPCSQFLLAQERDANGPVVRTKVQHKSVFPCIQVASVSTDLLLGTPLEPPPIRWISSETASRPSKNLSFQSSHFVRTRFRFPTGSVFQGGTSHFERRGSCDSRRTKRGCGYSNAPDFQRPCHVGDG